MKRFFALASFLAAANAQTVTLGPRSNYEQPPAATVTAAGDHLEIFPEDFSNGIPAEGIDVAFGPDLQAALSSAYDASCADGYTQECSDALAQALNTQETYTVESRVVGIDDLLIGAAAVAIFGVVVEAIFFQQKNQNPTSTLSYVHVPATDLSSIQSQTATSVVIATDTSTATITVAPTPVISSATFTTLTADQDGHSSGDIVISLPTAAAQMMSELIYKSDVSNECVNIQLRKRQSGGDLGAVNDVADYIMPFVPPQQLLQALGVEVGQQLPRLVDQAQQASLESAQAFAAGLAAFANLDAAYVNVLAETVWIGVVAWCADQLPDLHELVLQAGDYEADSDDSPDDDDDNEECPADAPSGKDAPLCRDDTCAGEDSKCTTGEYKGCKCLTVVTPHWQGGDTAFWSDSQFILQGLLSDIGWGCDSSTRVNLETKSFTALAEAFCKDVDLSTTVEKDVSPADADLSGYDDYTFKFTWTKKDDETCFGSCVDIFSAFTSTSECSYDSHTKSHNGYQDFTCGTAMFNITEKAEDDTSGSDDGVYVNLGNLKCGTETDQGNANHFTTLETMNKAAEWFCEAQVEKGLRWTPGQVADGDDFVEYHHNSYEYDPMYVTARWIDNAGCPTTDFGGDNAASMNATCKERFATITNECDTSDNGKYWWKQGGTFFRDCVEWSITRDTFQSEQPTTSDDWRPNRADCATNDDCKSFASESCSTGKAACILAADSWCSCSLN